MTVYVVAQLRFTDVASYRRYQAAFAGVWAKHPGRVLAADEHSRVMEGGWRGDKVVLLSFPSEAAYHAWADSDEYRAIARERIAGARSVVLLVQGLDAQASSSDGPPPSTAP